MKSLFAVVIFILMSLLFMNMDKSDVQFVSTSGEICGCLPWGEYDVRVGVACKATTYDVIHVSTCGGN